MDRHQGRGDRRRLPRQERDRERGVQALDPALPAVIRSDEPAARRQCPFWFSRPDDFVARPGSIRAAQSSYLSTNGCAGAARGLRRHGEEDARGARRQPGVLRLCAAHTEAGLGKAEQEIGRASCRERVWISVGGVSLTKKKVGAPVLSATQAIAGPTTTVHWNMSCVVQ